MKIVTCNIRCFGAQDGQNDWIHRRPLCIEVLQQQRADILCFQEMWAPQWDDLAAAFPGYGWSGMTDEPCGHNPVNSIFYRREAFTPLASGGYWLSEMPHRPGSRSWDSACIRLATWIRLRDRNSGAEFRILNTHLDHIGQLAREKQAQLLAEDASSYPPGYPQFLTGDLNCDCHNRAIAILKAAGWRDTYAALHGTENPEFTYHEFLGAAYPSTIGKMDWIFSRGPVEVRAAEIIKDSSRGRFPSDHYFVSATVVPAEPR